MYLVCKLVFVNELVIPHLEKRSTQYFIVVVKEENVRFDRKLHVWNIINVM